MRRLLLALAAMFTASVAQAQEINTDTGMDNPAEWMAETGWEVTGSKAEATNVTGLDMLMQHSDSIKKGHTYEITFDLSDYSGGAVRAYAGITMPTPTTGSWITAASTTDIADNFTYADGVLSTYTPKPDLDGPGDSHEGVGAFRFGGAHGKFEWADPLVNPGQMSMHLHEFYCNTNVEKDWDFTDFRTKGSSTCGNQNDPTLAVNRSGYWSPAMFDGKGNAIRLGTLAVYYKGSPDPTLDYTGDIYDSANDCANKSPIGDCRNIPTGLRMVAGYNQSTGLCGPADTSCNGSASYGFDCWTQDQVASPRYATIEAARTSGHSSCTIGNSLRAYIDMPSCLKNSPAIYVDSPNHRDHVSYPTSGPMCPESHPIALPVIGIMAFYMIDQDFLDGKWRLASDEMVPGGVAGSTLHFDYWEAWSPTARNAWYNNCIKAHNSCSLEFGDGKGLKTGSLNFNGQENGALGQHAARPDKKVPLRLYGMSKDFSANGTYTVELTAPGDGVFGFMGINGFTGKIDTVSVTEITINKGPVTVD